MQEFHSCKAAIAACIEKKYFSIAHLYNEEKPMDMHIHDSYEIYYSISGGKQFLIDNKFYEIKPGDLFVINQFESHYLTQIDQMVHERIVLSIHPDFLKEISTEQTNLAYCFTHRPETFIHKARLSKEQQKRFLYFINKIGTAADYGSDLMEYASFLELMILINSIYLENHSLLAVGSTVKYSQQVEQILAYINQNINKPITIEHLAGHFYLSESYICRNFKAITGTTINKYITARRICIAKSLLSTGMNVNDVCEQCGFNDYSNFLKAFTKAVGISPKKYSQCSIS